MMAFTHVYPRAFIPYEPKLPEASKINVHRLSSKPFVRPTSLSNASQTTQTGASSAEMLLHGNSWLEKNAGDCEAAASNAVGSGDKPTSAREHVNELAAENDSDNSDDEFPSIRRLLSPDYRHKLAKEGSLVQEGTAEKNISEALDLFGYGSTAGSSQDEPIVLESDSRSEYGHDALDLDVLPAPFTFSADKLEDSDNNDDDNGIDNNTSSRPAKRQRSASPRPNSNQPYASTPPLSHNLDMGISTEIADGSDSDESGDDNVLPKRRKLSDFPGDRIVLSSHSGRSQHSSSISEDPEGDDFESTADSNLASTAGTTPDVFAFASLTEPQPGLEVINANQDWEVRKIIGREDVDGMSHYLVEWSPTLEPMHLLGHAKELVDEFEARLRAQRGNKSRRGGMGSKIKKQAVADVSGGQQWKKPRGRPRKQK